MRLLILGTKKGEPNWYSVWLIWLILCAYRNEEEPEEPERDVKLTPWPLQEVRCDSIEASPASAVLEGSKEGSSFRADVQHGTTQATRVGEDLNRVPNMWWIGRVGSGACGKNPCNRFLLIPAK